jgi:hypothetical protein
MNKNSLGTIFLFIGVIIVILSLIADIIGLANTLGLLQDSRFGPIQIIGVVVGLILGGIGWYLKEKK